MSRLRPLRASHSRSGTSSRQSTYTHLARCNEKDTSSFCFAEYYATVVCGNRFGVLAAIDANIPFPPFGSTVASSRSSGTTGTKAVTQTWDFLTLSSGTNEVNFEDNYLSKVTLEKNLVFRPGRNLTVHLGPTCCVNFIVVHELLHIIGTFHEQTRPDRFINTIRI